VPDLNNSRRNRIHLTTQSDSLNELITVLYQGYVEARRGHEKALSKRQEEVCYKHVSIILLDLLAAWESDPECYIGYSRGRRYFLEGGSYWDHEKSKSALSGKFYLGLIDHFAELDLIENHIADAGYGGFSSRMRATARLTNLFVERDLNWACILVDLDAPSMFVKGVDKKLMRLPDPKEFDLEQAKSNLRRINENLQSSLINLNITDEQYDELKVRLSHHTQDLDENEEYREPLDFSNRSLRRIFGLGSFTNGGRFYGGWWQGLPSEYRKHIELEGSPVVEIDFSTMMPSILYAFAGAKPPLDSYDVPGWPKELRPVIKKAFNQLMNSDESSRPEGQWHRFAPDMLPDPLPHGWLEMKLPERNKCRRACFFEKTGRDYSELLYDLITMHDPIAEHFFSKAWGITQALDAQIAERVMIKLLDHTPQITVLPIHDSFIVKRGARVALENAMKDAYKEVLNAEGRVDVEEYAPDRDGWPRIIVSGEELHDAVRDQIENAKGYHLRSAQWVKSWGLSGYE